MYTNKFKNLNFDNKYLYTKSKHTLIVRRTVFTFLCMTSCDVTPVNNFTRIRKKNTMLQYARTRVIGLYGVTKMFAIYGFMYNSKSSVLQ